MIYLDYNATTPVDERVLEAMLPYFNERFGNPASRQHSYGWVAEEAVEAARESMAGLMGVDTREVTFTSGATESCNLAIKGVFGLYRRKGSHIVVLKTEHKAVIDTCNFLAKKGAEVTFLDVGSDGVVELDVLEAAIRPDTILVCAMWANNETGVIQPMHAIGEICERKGTLLFSDATQAAGKLEVNPREASVQLMACSGHKVYGPKGIGVLYVSNQSPRVKLEPVIHGGGHEGGFRSGTLNVPGIVGMAEALRIAEDERQSDSVRLALLRDKLEISLHDLGEIYINGAGAERLPHTSNIRFEHLDGTTLMAALKSELAIASGSACTSADPAPSHVLKAMGLSDSQVKSSLRFSLGRLTTSEEIDRAIEVVKAAVARERELSQVWKMHVQGLI